MVHEIAVEWASMTAGLVVAGIVVLGLLVIALRWRSQGGEQQALRRHQHALDTLRTVNDRLESSRPETISKPRPVRDQPAPPAAVPPWSPRPKVTAAKAGFSVTSATTRSKVPESTVQEAPPTPAPRPAPEEHNGADPALVFDDAVVGEPAPNTVGQPAPTRASMRALQRSSRPPSRLPAMLGVFLFVILIVVAAIVFVGKKLDNNKASTTTTTSFQRHHATKPKSGKVTTTTASSSTIPTTTLPPQVAPETGSASSQGAEYTAPATSYNVTLTSSGACWVYAVLPSTNAVVWTGVLEAGQSQILQASGQLNVELGHANTVTATLNGVNVQYPTGYQAVFTMKFVPSTL